MRVRARVRVRVRVSEPRAHQARLDGQRPVRLRVRVRVS